MSLAISLVQTEVCEKDDFYKCVVHSLFTENSPVPLISNGRYLDNTSIGGTLDVTKLIATGFIQSKAGDPTYGLRILSMMNSDITDVHYDGKLVDVVTVLR